MVFLINLNAYMGIKSCLLAETYITGIQNLQIPNAVCMTFFNDLDHLLFDIKLALINI